MFIQVFSENLKYCFLLLSYLPDVITAMAVRKSAGHFKGLFLHVRTLILVARNSRQSIDSHLPAGYFRKWGMSYLRLFHFLYINLVENPKEWFGNEKIGGSSQKNVFLSKFVIFYKKVCF